MTTANNENTSATLPESLPGINIQAGLALVRKKEHRYKMIASMFYNRYHNGMQEWNKAISNNDNDGAFRWTHNLKGQAGSLGATTLQQVAADLETALTSNNNLQSLSNHCESELKIVIQSLEKILEK